MSSEIFFPIILFLLGVLASLAGILLSKDVIKWVAAIAGILLIFVSGAWFGSARFCECDTESAADPQVTREIVEVEVTRIVTETVIETETISDWIVCWHGTGFERIENDEGELIGHEVLIAYPRNILVEGLRLDFEIFADWARSDGPLAQDSLKMCQIDGVWYGENYWDWFPQVSFLQLTERGFRACSDDIDGETVGCFGDVWDMLPSDSAGPKIEYIEPDGTDIQVIGYVWSEGFEGP